MVHAGKRFRSSVCAIPMALLVLPSPALAAPARKEQVAKTAAIPVCARKLGTVAVAEPDKNWWSDANLGSPETLLKMFVMKSGCFGLVDRNRGLAARAVERELAKEGELQAGSNVTKSQVKSADYVIVPDIVTSNAKAGGGGLGALGGMLGGLTGNRAFGTIGGVLGGLNFKKKEARVTLTLVNARTTEQERLTEGYAKKTDVGLGGGAFHDGLGGGAYGYSNTEIGQVISLAYLDAYTKLVQQLGGLPDAASAAAPAAAR